jgi:hypothetical protein
MKDACDRDQSLAPSTPMVKKQLCESPSSRVEGSSKAHSVGLKLNKILKAVIPHGKIANSVNMAHASPIPCADDLGSEFESG